MFFNSKLHIYQREKDFKLFLTLKQVHYSLSCFHCDRKLQSLNSTKRSFHKAILASSDQIITFENKTNLSNLYPKRRVTLEKNVNRKTYITFT